MPTYLYECPDCEHRLELEQSMSDEFRPDCQYCLDHDDCSTRMVRVIQPVGFVLNGKCWARDGYSK